jgi:hypothetical protein
MRHLERYTPEICSQLRQIAESRDWKSWHQQDAVREDLLQDLELSYHLHLAADVSGTRAGMPPMPPFPLCFADPTRVLDPEEFIKRIPQETIRITD